MRRLLSLAACAAILMWSVPALARGGGHRGGSHSVKTYSKKSGTVVNRHTAKNPRR
jgi:hypothetical protein